MTCIHMRQAFNKKKNLWARVESSNLPEIIAEEEATLLPVLEPNVAFPARPRPVQALCPSHFIPLPSGVVSVFFNMHIDCLFKSFVLLSSCHGLCLPKNDRLRQRRKRIA